MGKRLGCSVDDAGMRMESGVNALAVRLHKHHRGLYFASSLISYFRLHASMLC